MLATFQTYILGLSKPSLQKILALYPLSDFESFVRPDEDATAQYYRAAQINRDIWFTCPVIDFTWQYTRHGAPNIHLYEMNQTKFGPILKYMGVPQWRVCHLSDIPYMLNEDVAAGGDNSAAQRELSALLSGSAAAFAHTGNPADSEGRVFKEWPLAYPDRREQVLAKEHPENLNIYIVGGPGGSGPAHIAAERVGGAAEEREQALAGEKLMERCNFINSIQEEIGV